VPFVGSSTLRGESLTIASHIEDARPTDFLAAGSGDKARAFRAAMRHSRLVRFTRAGIPFAIVATIALTTAYWWLDPMRTLARLPVGADAVLMSGTKVVMRQPRLKGFTTDQRPYTVVARTAAKDLANPDSLEMEDVRATMVMPDRRDVEVTARDGFFDGKAQTVRLRNNVVVSSPEYEARLQDALLHVRKGHVVSEQPVVVNMLMGTISANRLEIQESGAIIRFERGVTLLIDREEPTSSVAGKRR
jgi:lipopolysaccharide export system protein LptC